MSFKRTLLNPLVDCMAGGDDAVLLLRTTGTTGAPRVVPFSLQVQVNSKTHRTKLNR
jgi:hypothetical protein